MADFDPERLTWSVLLARWTAFARGAVALPDAGEAGRVKQSVADIIALQAVWFAMGHLDELDEAERALGLDRAAVLIDRHGGAVRKRFEGQPLPEGLGALLDDVDAVYQANKKSK